MIERKVPGVYFSAAVFFSAAISSVTFAARSTRSRQWGSRNLWATSADRSSCAAENQKDERRQTPRHEPERDNDEPYKRCHGRIANS
jgi:hypothetical protein